MRSAHSLRSDEAKAIECLPDLTETPPTAMRAPGTEGQQQQRLHASVRARGERAGARACACACLASLLSGERRFVGEEKGLYFTRRLALRLDEASLSLAWPRDWAPPADWSRDAAFAPAFVDALRAWALVYAAIDCPGCDAYAVPDGLLLKQSRW